MSNNYAAVKKWRQKHREIYNLRQREYRRGRKELETGVKRYYDDCGREIMKWQWEAWQLKKAKAAEKGWEYDEYSQ